MKQTTLATALLLILANPAALLAQESAATEAAPESVVPAVSTGGNSGTPCPRHGMGMMHQGKGPHGGGHGMQHGSVPDKGQPAGNEQVVQRLDMIEARMAKIEAMLETLIRR